MITPAEIRSRIQAALPGSRVEVTDLTGGGDHYRVAVVATQFQDLGPVDRHRLVYAPFKDVLGGALHALSLDTRTPEEWAENQKQQLGPGGFPSLPRL
jgi:acid stress-induced BolA-like protein IbaG/YrbA